MYPIRSFFVLLIFFFGLNFVGEFLVGPMMGESVPAWKISAVSLVSALTTIIPLQKRGLKPGDIFKYFRRSYVIPGLDLNILFPYLTAVFPAKEFVLELDADKDRVFISRKANLRSFGEVLRLQKQGAEIKVFVRPKYYLDLFDQGQAYESLLRLEQVLNQKRHE